MPQPQEKFLKDYQPPAFIVEQIHLTFDLDEEETLVHSAMKIQRAPEAPRHAPLVLDGEALELVALHIDGRSPESDELRCEPDRLVLSGIGDRFTAEITTRISPKRNTDLSGLYASGNLLCTQCEAEGFRRITYYPDRPDVLALFRTTIRADRSRFPVLLSNGNLIASGPLDDDRHFATWDDPFPKPSYLFALVAGDLAVLRDEFTTCSGRKVLLEIYAVADNLNACHHAMASLKQAMAWDEETFGLEYDLDRYMIVAVHDFNMGAMENKGLNIFNTNAVLATPQTATDDEYRRIRGVIGHEYFHNWTGNRVTCRDWFQLSLKEGLTVFRDQEFTSDLDSRTVKRIQDVQLIRMRQFPEDAGPMAHPVRPNSYIEMNNFYTVTVYFKGAEVIRMLHTLLGRSGFRRGMDLYFARHDGQAVTCDDFVAAMEDANGIDLTQFRRWYRQAGTPRVTFAETFDAETKTYCLEATQSCPETPGQRHKEPFHIPIKFGLLSSDGSALDLQLIGEEGPPAKECILNVTQASQKFCFSGVEQKPLPSLMRDFSAPVRVVFPYGIDDLCFLLAHDPNAFNRWDAGQQLFQKTIFSFVDALGAGTEPQLPQGMADALGRCLEDRSLDPALVSEILRIPGLETVSQDMDPLDIDLLDRAHKGVAEDVSQGLRDLAEASYDRFNSLPVAQCSPQQRALKNRCLALLTHDGSHAVLALDQFQKAENMTDQLAALVCLSHFESAERSQALDAFYRRWHSNPLVLDKWFAIQAASRHPDTVSHVIALSASEDFTSTNPNRVYALIHTFIQNLAFFHVADGQGYAFVAEKIRQLDQINVQVAARIARAFSNWRRFDPHRQELIRGELNRLMNVSDLSKGVFEVISKTLS